MPGIGVLTNPLSRRNKRDPRLAGQLAYVLGEKGNLEMPDGIDALAVSAARFAERDIDVLCINGGDGTIHKALTALVHAWPSGRPLPRVAVLPGGTMNIIANSIGVRGRPAEILDWIVSTYHLEAPLPTTRRSLMRFRSERLERDQFGFLFGNGLLSSFLELYYEGGNPTPSKAAWLLFRGVCSTLVRGPLSQRLMQPWQGEVKLDGRAWPHDTWLAVSAGTVEQIGLGFTPFHQVPRYPDHLHGIGLASTLPQFAAELPRVYRGVPLAHPNNLDAPCRTMELTSTAPFGFMIDGDFHRAGTTLTLDLFGSVELIVPPKA